MRKVNHQKVSKKVWVVDHDTMVTQKRIKGYRVREYRDNPDGSNTVEVRTVYPQPLSNYARVTAQIEDMVRVGIRPDKLPYHTFYKLKVAIKKEGK